MNFLTVVFILVKQLSSNGINEVFEHSQLVNATWPWAYSALCISSGYFAYDQLDMLIYGLYSGWIPSILLHHFILLGCFTLALYRNVTINYLILTLICELHSIFLHVRKIRRMAGLRDGNSKFVKIEWFLNICTFLLARLLSHVLITVKLLNDASKFEKGIELPLALFGMAGMNLLNVFLGMDLLKAFRRERTRDKTHES
ncbi:TLC domain-containing protein 2 [Tanacetum coccineum]